MMNSPITPYAEYLLRQGLDAEDARLLKLELLDAKGVSAHVGFRTYNAGILIPYPDTEYSRVRLLGKLRPGGPKYLSVKGAKGSPVFFPPGRDWNKVKQDVREDLIVTEGELKAYTGSKSGPAVVGIGGVDMQAGLFECGIAWKGRRVFICFDKDAGYAAGTYKPEVSNALGRLASSLMQAGATVLVMHIPGEVDTKLGLDDYLNVGGSLNDLAGGAAAPPEWCEELGELLDECVYVTGTSKTHVFNRRNKSRKLLEDFHAAHISKVRIVGSGSDAKVQQLSRIWQRRRDKLEVEQYALDPQAAYCEIVKTDNVTKLNMWTPYPERVLCPDDRKTVVQAEWQKFIEGVFGDHWKWVASWTAHMLFKPWERSNQAVLVLTPAQGIGKSLYGEIVGKLMGDDHFLECQKGRMFDKFNPEMEGRILVMVNELDKAFNSSIGSMNELLTMERMFIEHKGTNKYDIENYRRWYLTSNSAVPFLLAQKQRRVLVVCPPRMTDDTRGEWGQWVGDKIAGVASWKRDAEALAAIWDWFEDLWEDVGADWNPTAPVPETAASVELAEASLSEDQRVALAVWEYAKERGFAAVQTSSLASRKGLAATIAATVKAEGGDAHKKGVKEAGKTADYTVYECANPNNFKSASNGSHVSLREAEEIRLSSVATLTLIREKLKELEALSAEKWH